MVHSNIVSIAPIAKGETPDTAQEAILRSTFHKQPHVIFELKINKVLQQIVVDAFNRFPILKTNPYSTAYTILMLGKSYAYMFHQPSDTFKINTLETREEWIKELADPKLKKRRGVFITTEEMEFRMRLPEMIINAVTHDCYREDNVHTIEDLVAICLDPKHKHYSAMEPLIFLAVNIIHNMTAIENEPSKKA